MNNKVSGSIIIAIPLLIAGAFFMLMGIKGIQLVSQSNHGNNPNSSFPEALLVIIAFSTVGLMSILASYKLITKKKRIFPQWFIISFSGLYAFGILYVIIVTRNFLWLGAIVAIGLFNYKLFYGPRNGNKTFNTNKYFK